MVVTFGEALGTEKSGVVEEIVGAEGMVSRGA